MDSPNQNPRWPLERAVFAARIPPIAKLIMLALLTKAGPVSLDLGERSPSTRKLTGWTSLKRDTVISYLSLLETHGWLTSRKRSGLPTEYALSQGEAFEAPGTRRTPPVVSRDGDGRWSRVVPLTGPVGGPADGTGTGPTDGTGGGPVDGAYTEQVNQADRRPDQISSFLGPNGQAEPDPYEGIDRLPAANGLAPPPAAYQKSRSLMARRAAAAVDMDEMLRDMPGLYENG